MREPNALGGATTANLTVAGCFGEDRIIVSLVLAVAAASAAVVGTMAVLRYEAFASDFDHGIFSQYVWLLGHLREPFNTVNLRFLLGDHVEPGIALLAPLGTLGVGAVGLLIAQALALAATAPLLYVLARILGVQRWLAAVPALLWCASPVVLRVGLHDFHPEALVPAAFVAGCIALARDRIGWFVVFAILGCAMKEDVALTYAALGLVIAWNGRRRLGAAITAATGSWAVIATYVVLPGFGNADEEEFGPRFAGERGDSFSEALRFMIVNPLTTLEQSLGLDELGILVMLVATCGGLCLVAPRWLLVAVPAAALNLLSAYDLQHTINYHYWIVAAVSVSVAGVVGASRLPSQAVGTWLRIAGGTGIVLGLLSLQWLGAITAQIRFEWPKRADRSAVLARIPGDASVSAPMQMLSHLSERERLYVLPEPLLAVRVGTEWDEADRSRATAELDYIVFDPGLRSWGAPTEAEIQSEIGRRGYREIMRRGETRLYARARLEGGP